MATIGKKSSIAGTMTRTVDLHGTGVGMRLNELEGATIPLKTDENVTECPVPEKSRSELDIWATEK